MVAVYKYTGASIREAAEILKLKDNVGTGTNGYEEARNKLGKKLERENNPLRSSCLEQASNRDYMTKSGFQSDGSD